MNSTQDKFYLSALHPVLRDHVVHGRHVLPGLAYIDLFHQSLRDQGFDHRGWSLRNLSIYHPLSIAAGNELTIELERHPLDETTWRIELHGQDTQAGGSRRCYCSVLLSAIEPERFDETLDLEAIVASGAERTSLDLIYRQCREQGLVHGGFMQPCGARYATADAIYIDCAVDPAFSHDGMDLMFHPALLDGCAIGVGSLSNGPGAGVPTLFLPIAIESFRASHLLPDRCVARIRTDGMKLQQDLFSMTLELFDDAGAKVAELKNLTTKAVRDPSRLDPSLARDERAPEIRPAAKAGPATPAPAPPTVTTGDELRRQLQEFLQRIVAQRLGVAADQVDARAGFYDLGLDSASLLKLVHVVEGRLQVPLPPTLLFEHTNVRDLAEHLSVDYGAQWRGTDRSQRADTAAPPAAVQSVQSVQAPPAVRVSVPRDAGDATDIAIIGMAGRFPQAADVRELWANLLAAKDCVTEVPASRWDWRVLDEIKSASGKDMSRWGGFIADAECFDAEFFHIVPREAEMMDPQERQFLEVAWAAIEDAGYTPATLVERGEDGRRRAVGVFAGAMHKDYTLVGAQRLQERQVVPLSLSAGMIANRVSYFCNFHGPSITIDTMCSSSLTAVHLALESVRHGECEVALAGGVNLSLHPAKYLTYGIADMHASDGRCRSFGAGGDGYVSAEGIGVVVLKPLRKALADRDAVYAVVKGSAVNHVGAVGGVTVPSPTAQADVIRQCLHKVGFTARTISYVEAHGTGTSLGDPIEIEGLGKAFRHDTQDVGFCAIGSLKSNIGHAEAASGVAGLIKTALQLKHRVLVASLHAQALNPHIDWQRSPFVVQTRTEKWRRPKHRENGLVVTYPRRASLSSFGATGSNAHVILEEFREPREASDVAEPAVVVLSARNADRLHAQAQRLLAHLDREDVLLADLAYTLQVGREAFNHRLAIVTADTVQLKARLASFVETGTARADEDCFVGDCRQYRDALGLLTDDEDSAEFVAKWLAKGKLRKIAQLWIKGFVVDWKRLYGPAAPRRVHLPGYAFARQRYWLPDAEPAPVPAMDSALVGARPAAMADATAPQSMLLTPQWEPSSPVSPAAVIGEHWVLFAGWPDAVSAQAWPSARVETLADAGSDRAGCFEHYGWQLLQRVQSWLQDKPRTRLLIQVVIPAGEETLYALAGLLKTARLEQPLLRGQVIGVEAVADARRLAAQLAQCAASDAAELRCMGMARQERHYRPLPGTAAAVRPWKRDGVYLISGGGGGLGCIVAEAIGRDVGMATVVLVGRSAARDLPQSAGLTVDYRRADVTDAAAVEQLVAAIVERYGRLDGIVHSAGVIRDGFLLRKSEAQYREVLAPKVRGVVNLDRATRHLGLDAFVLFSSATGAHGNLGQGDYALANAFLDAYAHERAQAVARGECQGRTVSIGWPLWVDGGMQVGIERREAMRALGADAMPTAQGLEALHRAYGSGAAQVQVLYGTAFAPVVADAASTPAPTASIGETSELRPRTLQQLRRLYSAVTKLDAAQIDMAEPLESYGIDSILIMQLNKRLTDIFGELSKTLFYEYPTLAELGDFLVREHRAACERWCGMLDAPALPAASAPTPQAAAPLVAPTPHVTAPVAPIKPVVGAARAIAVIGLAGRYPQARDVDTYWDNLREGRDGITEIPAERWPLDGFFEPDMERAIATGRSYGKWGGFIDGFAEFDALFFNISPREAMNVDPQERLFLETCWAAMEDAGYTRERFVSAHQRRVGVFAGVTKTGFELYGPELRRRGEMVAPWTSFGSLANRVSYVLNLQGPSMPIDTMCSASLTAIHEACEHLLRDECELAFAGGVNLYLHPANYAMLCSSRMLSASGRCHSFGTGGDGFVPGEGVGVVLLKPLAQAVADRDRIHGVIRATGVNHGGKTNGYTVPNPVAQRDLIAATLVKAGIDARTVSYIEAHGTGTSLGDPIEITGLTQAFARHTADKQFCAIGSVKSNIGHAESAAGIAGLTKVLLQMRHRQLVPSLHAQTLNPNIDFSTTPFVVQRALADWERPQVTTAGVTAEYPRIAGISSFGAGGANAHVIVEEFVAPAEARFTRTGPVLCVLSARSEERLKARAQQLLDAIRRRGLAEADLADIAYTLQVGREAMDYRLAFTVDTLAALSGMLQRYVGGDTAIDGLHRGDAKRNKEALSALTEDDEFDETIAKWLARGKHAKVLGLWVKGLAFDWTRLYPHGTPRIIALPTYPFARETHWLPLSGMIDAQAAAAVAASKLHPLLHANTSTLNEQRYSSLFTGEEFFLADHRVHGSRVLPGVAYLEMAQQAVGLALERDADGRAVTLKDVVWLRPLRIEAPTAVHIRLDPLESGEVGFEVYTQTDIDDGTEDDRRLAHATGRVEFAAARPRERVDVSALRQGCDRRVDAGECYAAFDVSGVNYGPAHRGIRSLQVGADGTSPFVLAQLALPEGAGAQQGSYVLHPGILDSALQASIGFAFGTASAGASSGSDAPAAMPFAIDDIEILGATPARGFALVRSRATQDAQTQKYDVDVCDEDGELRVRIRGFVCRPLASPDTRARETTGANQAVTSLLLPRWDAVARPFVDAWPAPSARLLVVGGSAAQQQALRQRNAHTQVLDAEGSTIDTMATALSAHEPFDHVVWIAAPLLTAPDEEQLIDAQEHGVIALFRLVKAFLASGYGARALGWTVLTTQSQQIDDADVVHPAHAGIHGFVGSLAKEYAHWPVRLVDLPAGEDGDIDELLRLPANPKGDAWAYRSGEWFRQQLLRFEPAASTAPAFRDGGVYVLIGGASGIGQVFSEYLIRRHRAQVVWIGRRAIDDTIEQSVRRLSVLGPAPLYLQADAADRDDLARAHRQIRARHARIDGIVHSAIVLLDKSIANMEEERLRTALRAKVDVCVRIAQVFADDELDFVLFFSALQSFVKSAGQSNYAAGCTFKDAFAYALDAAWPCAVKVVNWGFWGTVGTVSSEYYRQRMQQAGIGSIEPDEGLRALEALFASSAPQLAVVTTLAPQALAALSAAAYVQVLPAPAAGSLPVASDRIEAIPAELIADDAARASQAEFHEQQLLLLYAQLRRCGLFDVPLPLPATASVRRWFTASGTRAFYERWIVHSVRVLTEAGLLRESDEGLVPGARAPLDIAAVWSQWEDRCAALRAQPGIGAQIDLIDTTLRALPDVLTGRRLATDFLFPQSKMGSVEGVYSRNALADHFNAVLAGVLLAQVRHDLSRDPQRRLRILEIGAGTGGTSAMVFEKLRPHERSIDEYTYTDISKSFLMHAEEHFAAAVPYLRCRLFNVEQPLRNQSIETGSYDFAIATNVLHATRNIRTTLRNAKAALRSGGLLLLNETNGFNLYTHLTFGLLEGWWLFEDEALRIPGTPALHPAAWRHVLEAEGFDAVHFPAESAHDLGQQVVIARSDGIVTQAVTEPRARAGAAPASNPPPPAPRDMPAPKLAPKPAPEATQRADRDRASQEDFVRRMVAETIAAALKVSVDLVDADEPFADYGLDSILGVHAVHVISKQLGISLNTTALFDHSTVTKLSAHILAEHALPVEIGAVDAPTAAPLVEDARTAVVAPAAPLNSRFAVASTARSAAAAAAPVVVAVAVTPADSGGQRPPRLAAVSDALRPPQLATATREPIAIIGMSARYPHCDDVEQLWQHLASGDDLIDSPGEGRGLPRGVVSGIDQFDALFFTISGVEATYMDPQQRLFLEESWKALEDAGYVGDAIEGSRCGVYLGSTAGDYSALMPQANVPPQAFWGNSGAITPARIAYFLDLQGPAVAIDTACSSSLVAMHMGCQALRAGEVALALAGGVFIQASPAFQSSAGNAGMLSPNGRCYTFDDRADGFVASEGVGVVVLKRLSDALAAHDHVYGVIRGSGINQDGATNGITAPSALSQERLECDVYDTFGIDPSQISLIEAHGTGTKLGDPIEFQALTKAFRRYTSERQFCAIGSIKTNLGHAAVAAGVAGVIKVLLSLKHEQIPASLHFATGNGHIDFASSPFFVNTALRPWRLQPGRPRLAAVSSFGFSGTNAHVVIEEAPQIARVTEERPAYLVVLSARSTEQVRTQAERLLAQIERNGTPVLGDIAYTLLAGRKHFAHRLACVVSDPAALTAALTRWLAGNVGESVHVGEIKDKNSRERAALKDYGQACLAACVEGSLTAADYRQQLGVLADLYVQGYSLDLAALLADGGFGRVSLPTYPFARQRYWVEAAAVPIAAPVAAVAATSTVVAQVASAANAVVDATAMAMAMAGEDIVGALTLVPQWNLLPADAVSARPAAAGRVLIIEDDTSRHAALRVQYPDAVVIDIDEVTIESLAAQLSAELGDTLVWCAPPAQLDAAADALIAGQENGVLRGLLLLQALLRAGYGERPLALTVITQLAQSVVPGEAIDATQASIWGLIGSAAKEQPAWQVRLFDVETAAERAALIGSGLLHAADPHGNGRALRGGRWYGPVCVPCTLPAPARPAYRRNGVYVVIGGAGGVGAVLTEHLIRHYQARVIWLGRRDADAAIHAQQQHLAQWGEAPEYLAVDARDAAALQAAREAIVARYGVIHGVVHAALVMSGSDLAQMSAERFRAGLSAKVDVSVRLVEAFAGAVQDFVVWFSSIQALEKTRRQSNYAAGSTFVDAYATQVRERLGCAVKVIDWGYWASTGVASAMPSFQNWLAQAGMSAIDPAAGLAALEQLIASPLAHVAYLNTHRAGALQGVTFAPEQVRVATIAAPVAIDGFVPTPFTAEAQPVAADARVQELQTLLLDMIVCRLSEIGPAELCETFDAWRARSSLATEFERWFDATARLLVQRYGSEAAVLSALAAPDGTAPERWTQWVQFGRDYAQLALVEGTLAVMPAILRGEQSATAVLFPQATMQRVEGVYHGNPVTDYANAVVAQATRHYIESRLAQDPTARLRLIEIGAGTGGTSAVVFEALKDYATHIDEYAYTDVSKAFLHYAQERFAPTTPYLRGRVFDAERGPAEQGIAADYDIAIATNVLHATRDIREALRHVKAALKGQGIVLLHELTGSSLLGHLTFGLLPGWWRFEDVALRVPGGPLVAPENWERALTAEGYGAIGFLTPVLHESTQVIIAQSNGVAREPWRMQATVPAAAPATLVPMAAAAVAPAAVVAAPVVSTAFVSAHVRQVVLERLAEALMIELAQIRPDDSFAEYGLDSLLGVRTVEAINATLGTTLTSTSVFDFSSVNALTEQIMATDGARLAAMLSVGTAPAPAVAASAPAPVRAEAPAPLRVETPAPVAAVAAPRVVTTMPVDMAVPPAIAVIGMSGRYPQSRDLTALWDHLAAGDDLTEPVTRWDLPAILGDTPFCPRGGFLDGIAEFDALFFNISGLEATHMDPQQRLFLQESWKALEDAGYVGAAIAGRRCGVYAGYNGGDYHLVAAGGPAPAQALWGAATSMVSARIAYYLDLQGPAITIDTACSSSLVAIHLASQALRTGEVDLALAGGVFVQCAPSLYLGGERAGMLSPHGRCYTFDDRADGFVPGEGVGAVVLKRLDDALADGDHLYGVIRGSGINQDGATNGITAPSARSQERLEREVYERFGIDPDGIGLVEAHGTGTKLGDPIEFHALTRAFRQHTPREGYCAIGSIKSNLGHTTAASGVAGVLKVLLSLKHRQIAPSVNYSQSNRHIAFAGSPFYVPTQVKAWEPQPGHPRRAAVSAFGLSGTNAHVVIEEAPAHVHASAPRPGHLIVLSARSAAQLKQQAQQLIAHGEQHADLDLGHVSYTLLVGRKHFEHRLACVVRSTAELAARLQTWLTHGKAPQLYAAKSAELDDGGQAGLKRYGQQCLADCAGSLPESEHLERLAAVAELHVQGYALDYAALFAGQSPARLPLPTYPFATTQYWVEMEPGVAVATAKTRARATLHPLVHENTSDFWQQRYSSVFTGAEMQFADHRVQGRRLLPGVAYLEMVHAAVSRSSGLQGFAGDPDRTQRQETVTAMVMRNVVWLRPVIAAGDTTPISITLVENEAGEIEFEIFSQDHAGSHPAGDEPSPHTHAQGRAILAANIDDAMPGSYRRIDLDRLRSNRSRSIDVDDCYAVYSSVGIEYGPAHRSLASVDIGTDSLGPYVLAEVRLPECTLDTQRQYALHPSILDGALQAGLALEFADEQAASPTSRGPVVPFALEEAVITQRSPERAFVHIRAVDGERATPGLRKMNIDICDSAGRICVQLRGISSRELRADARGGDIAATLPADSQAPDDALNGALLASCWEAETPQFEPDAGASPLCLMGEPGTDGVRLALQDVYPMAQLLDIDAGATIAAITERFAAQSSLGHLVWIAPPASDDQSLSEAHAASVLGCFRMIKALLGLGHGDRPFELTVVTTQASVIDAQQPVNAAHAGVHGLIGSLAKEYEHWKVRLLDLPADEPWPYDRLLRMPVDGQGSVWAYRDSEWLLQQMLPCDVDSREYAYRDGGVYVILGGAGGLGEVLSEHLVREYGAQVVWLGRRECDATIRQKIERLAQVGGPAPHYVRADATQRGDVERAYREIKERHGKVHGIVHSAIALLDKSLANMDEERFCDGLAPKVEASIHLAEVFADEPLDFALFFSSFQSFARARGQANYAAGCTFKDAFVHELARSWRCPVKVMNWGYWGSIGIVASADTQQRMAQLGVDSIEPAEGIAALDRLLAGPFTQLAFMKPVRASGTPEAALTQIVELPAGAPAVDVSIFSKRRIAHDA